MGKKKTTKKMTKKVVKKTTKKTVKKIVKKAAKKVSKKSALKTTKKTAKKTTKKVVSKKIVKKVVSKKAASLLEHEAVVVAPRKVPSYQELLKEKKAVEERIMRIQNDLRSPLDQDADEQSLQLENREVLERLQDIEEENLLRINADLAIARK